MHNTRKIFIGAAWPYANGSLHLGHASALIGSDILARYFRLHGDDVLFVSGSDCHGTPIAFEADRQGVSPSEIAEKYHKEFTETLIDGLGFSYDIFTKTATENHYKFVQEIFLDLYKKGFIYSKETELPYCKKCNKFLPDRYIEGECPHCHFSSARGDQCDECGSLIDPKQLIKPKCKICGNVPVWKNSEHFYFKLSAFQEKILEWIKNSKGWRKNAKNFSTNFVNRGLQDRAITRDISWGVPIPLPGYEKIKAFMSGLRLFVAIFQLAKKYLLRLVTMICGKIFGKTKIQFIIMSMEKTIFRFILLFGHRYFLLMATYICQIASFRQNI